MAPSGRERQLILFAVAALLGGGVLLWALYLVREVLLVLYVSGLLAIGFSPVVRRFERGFGRRGRVRLPRWAAILVLYLGLVVVVVLAIAIVLPPFVRQARALWLDLPRYVDNAQQALVRAGLMSGQWTSADLIAHLPNPGFAVAQILGALQSAAGIAGTIVTVVILPYYLLLEADALRGTFIKVFARERRPQVARVVESMTEKVGAWLGGQLLLSLVIGVSASIGLWLLGVPYFYVFAVIAAFGELIPVVGPILAAIPAVLVSFSVSVQTGAFVAGYFALQQFLEYQFVVPRVMERKVGVSAVTVIVALLVGTELLGITGALLAVPSAAIVQVLAQEYLERE
ncbi:MAG: AI-2E family transporter [Vicinamibacterales bacterium]